MRTRRVGSFTCGILLIFFGLLFILHMLIPTVTYTFIFRFWPLILICLGVEIIISNINIRKTEAVMKYDAGAVVLLIVLAVFAMGMGCLEACMKWMNASLFM